MWWRGCSFSLFYHSLCRSGRPLTLTRKFHLLTWQPLVHHRGDTNIEDSLEIALCRFEQIIRDPGTRTRGATVYAMMALLNLMWRAMSKWG